MTPPVGAPGARRQQPGEAGLRRRLGVWRRVLAGGAGRWAAAGLAALGAGLMGLTGLMTLTAAPAAAQGNLDSTVILPPSYGTPGLLDYPRRRAGLWEIRNASADNLGMPPTRYCVGERTDTPENHLDRTAGEKGSCSIGPFRRVGISWVADSVCKEARSTVVSQSVATGDFQTQYRIDTLVFYSPPLANNRREDKEAVVARWLGPCPSGQRPGDLVVPGMGVLNMSDGTLRPEAGAAGGGAPRGGRAGAAGGGAAAPPRR
ncbi:MAG: DUF3617 domain-containing protein [Lautropia sp.]